MIQGSNNYSNGSGKTKNGKKALGKSDKASDSMSKKKDCGVKSWMLEPSKDGDPKSMMKNEKEYHWCLKYAKGEG